MEKPTDHGLSTLDTGLEARPRLSLESTRLLKLLCDETGLGQPDLIFAALKMVADRTKVRYSADAAQLVVSLDSLEQIVGLLSEACISLHLVARQVEYSRQVVLAEAVNGLLHTQSLLSATQKTTVA